MTIRAKMHCDAVSEGKSGNSPGTLQKYSETVCLSPVYGKDGSANAQWSKATPCGRLEMTITNPDAWGTFKPGAFYFVDLTEATEDA